MRTVTRYSTTLPFSTTTFCSEIQALVMFLMVSDARETPTCTASSNDLVEPAEISIIFATDIVTSFLIWVSPKGARSIDQRKAEWVTQRADITMLLEKTIRYLRSKSSAYTAILTKFCGWLCYRCKSNRHARSNVYAKHRLMFQPSFGYARRRNT